VSEALTRCCFRSDQDSQSEMNSTKTKDKRVKSTVFAWCFAREPELIAVSLFLVEFANATFFITIVLFFWNVTVEGCAVHP